MGKNNKGEAMNDFDFEELDKAVSSLAAKTKTENNLPPAGSPSPVTVTPAARRSSPVAPSVPITTPPPAPRGAAIPTPASPSAKEANVPASEPAPSVAVQHTKRLAVTSPKRRGAFMDIMAPSKGSARRTGPTLQPVTPQAEPALEPQAQNSQPEPVATKAPTQLSEPAPTGNTPPPEAKHLEDHAPEIMAKEVAAPQPEPKTTPKNQESSAKTDDPAWPDPLDFHEISDTPQHPPKDITSDEPPEGKAPTSPFLPEAKVEKRPLGAFSSFTSKLSTDESTAPIPSNAPELNSDDELTPEAGGVFAEPEVPKAPTMHDAPKEKETPKEESNPEEHSKPTMHERAMMSIPKQYHTEDKPADTTKRPIFDTKEYHPPLLEAAVHEHRGGGSMWSKLFIALATLVLLGVAGYFAYLYFVQQ